jgi:predicted HicB family RNase H-like nuclease
MLRYRGYLAKVDFDEQADVFYGVVINSRALLSFEGTNSDEVKQSFHDVVDSYLETCSQKTGDQIG